jgi:diguanylate cyclase
LISLKRYLDADHSALLKPALDSYRAALAATGVFGTEACPSLGQEFQHTLWNLQHALESQVTPAGVIETERCFETELKHASTRAAGYLKQKTVEIKELLIALARTTEAVGERDQRYTRQFHDFSRRLDAIADLDDLAKIRGSLVQSARELKACVDDMTRDSEASVGQLRAEISTYQTKLVETERLASRDPLTGLGNRRRIEFELEDLEKRGRSFCLMMLDINGFKQINDSFGHLAGDQVLKQFAAELQATLRAAELVGRWGGDEFLVILSGTPKEAESLVLRIRNAVFGDYSVEAGGPRRKVKISAAIGVAFANPGETGAEAIERADAEMYRDKATGVPLNGASPAEAKSRNHPLIRRGRDSRRFRVASAPLPRGFRVASASLPRGFRVVSAWGLLSAKRQAERKLCAIGPILFPGSETHPGSQPLREIPGRALNSSGLRP